MSFLPILGFWGTRCLIPSRIIQFQLVGDILASFPCCLACTMSTHLTSNCSNASKWKAWHLLCSKENTNKHSFRSQVVDHTLCNSDQNVNHWICHPTPKSNGMALPLPIMLDASPSSPNQTHLEKTQHNGKGLHHSIVNEKFGQQCALNSLQTSCMRYYTFVSVQERKWHEIFQAQH
jgi:hypothetical protein